MSNKIKNIIISDIEHIDLYDSGWEDGQAYAGINVKLTREDKAFKLNKPSCFAVVGDLERDLITEDVVEFINEHINQLNEDEEALEYVE